MQWVGAKQASNCGLSLSTLSGHSHEQASECFRALRFWQIVPGSGEFAAKQATVSDARKWSEAGRSRLRLTAVV